MLGLNHFLPANGFSIKPLEVKRLAGEQKATEERDTTGLGECPFQTDICAQGRVGGGAGAAAAGFLRQGDLDPDSFSRRLGRWDHSEWKLSCEFLLNHSGIAMCEC